jgi:hypothetical protein
LADDLATAINGAEGAATKLNNALYGENGLTSAANLKSWTDLIDKAKELAKTYAEIKESDPTDSPDIQDPVPEPIVGLRPTKNNDTVGPVLSGAALIKRVIGVTAENLDTGGYTGSWGSDGRLAMLHEKELVLNATDTANILKTVEFVREMQSAMESQVAGLIMNMEASTSRAGVAQ